MMRGLKDAVQVSAIGLLLLNPASGAIRSAGASNSQHGPCTVRMLLQKPSYNKKTIPEHSLISFTFFGHLLHKHHTHRHARRARHKKI
jgi:hypothetical protein